MTRIRIPFSSLKILLLVAVAVSCSLLCFSSRQINAHTNRRLLIDDPKTVVGVQRVEIVQAAIDIQTSQTTEPKMYPTDDHPNGPEMPYALPPYAAEWCLKPNLQPLPYTFCNQSDMINELPLIGGLTNALKMVLLGTILSFEENRCFYIDESKSHLHLRANSSSITESFIGRYFEPIGLSVSDAIITKARVENRIQRRDWPELWTTTRNRRARHQTFDIPSLYYSQMPGHRLKGVMLRRMFRWLPHVQQTACHSLETYGLLDEFMAFSVRRGDKTLENFEFATTEQYIQAAQAAFPLWFNNVPPKIFVATDDCSIMAEFREKRPSWIFVSECDRENSSQDHGFALNDVKDWDDAATDRHYNKFFVELLAMASAKYFIGVWYTNVSWWAFFMRRNDLGSFQLLETKGKPEFLIKWW